VGVTVTETVRNILWIMADQLRYDYLSCAGHPHLHTPHIDALAARGVRFDRAYVQSTTCGSSRMSYYTSRYVRSHGVTWNAVPLRVDELTLGDYLKDLDMRTALVGKTHMAAHRPAMKRLGIEADSAVGVHVAQCGFEPYERDDGLNPTERLPQGGLAYNRYMQDKGYDGENPWHDWANAAEDDEGNILSGWLLAHADKPVRAAEEDTETPYMTRRAMQFIDEAEGKGQRWCCHLSYIKPHWPYVAPAPYHDMYGADDLIPAVRSEIERQNPHPVYDAFMQMRAAEVFSREGVREHVLPAYMGLIKQIDDQIGNLMAFLEERGLLDNTMIVFCSDHGDYLGDHWMGEKDMFHEQSVRVPMIIYDPRHMADATRGTVDTRLVEGVDLLPTFVEACGGEVASHIVEGRSLVPLLTGEAVPDWRQVVFSEYDYGHQRMRILLDRQPDECRMIMVFDGRYKMVYFQGYRPLLHDLETDPEEYFDLGEDPEYAPVIERLTAHLHDWALSAKYRVTRSDSDVAAYAENNNQLRTGIILGFWDEAELLAARKKAGLVEDDEQ